jgi:thiol-disulfide isomerase/thioredoxin
MKILKWGLAIFGVLAVLAMGLFVWAIYTIKNPDMPRSLPEMATEVVKAQDGSKVKIGDLIKPGQPTILTFWASWCGQCYGEAKEIQRLKNRYGPDQLNIVYLNGEPKDAVDPSDANDFVAGVVEESAVSSQDLDKPPLVYYFADPAAYLAISGTAMIVFPRTYIFDRSGKPIKASTGYDPEQFSSELTPAVERAIKAKS